MFRNPVKCTMHKLSCSSHTIPNIILVVFPYFYYISRGDMRCNCFTCVLRICYFIGILALNASINVLLIFLSKEISQLLVFFQIPFRFLNIEEFGIFLRNAFKQLTCTSFFPLKLCVESGIVGVGDLT